MEPIVRWGVLGNATIARVCVIPAIVKARNSVLHAVASRSLQRAEALTRKYGGVAVEGYRTLLADPQIDVVYIPLPNHLHCRWALAALAAGKHVLVEKPIAMNRAEAQQMTDAAQAAGRLLMEALMYRFHPRSRRIKQLVAEGELGKIGSVQAAFCFPVESGPQNRRLFDPQMGGGSLMDVGCYGVSVARWLLNAEPEAVSAAAIYSDRGVDLSFAATLHFADGVLATINSSFVTTLQQTYAVYGSRAAVEMPHDAFVPWERDATFTLRQADEERGMLHTVAGVDEYQLMIEHFADAVVGDSPLDYLPQDSVRQMHVLDCLTRAALERRTITVDPLPILDSMGN